MDPHQAIIAIMFPQRAVNWHKSRWTNGSYPMAHAPREHGHGENTNNPTCEVNRAYYSTYMHKRLSIELIDSRFSSLYKQYLALPRSAKTVIFGRQLFGTLQAPSTAQVSYRLAKWYYPRDDAITVHDLPLEVIISNI